MLADAVFHIIVATDSAPSEYTISVTSNGQFTNLQPGVPVQDFLQGRNWEFFQVEVSDTQCNLTVTLTPVSGDPDLYMNPTV